MRNLLILSLVLFGCSDDKTPNNPPADAAVTPDAASTDKLDCATYCGKVTANCTGTNAQFPDATQCMQTCAKFTPGALTDTSGDTLGCRIYHANNAKVTNMPEVHCVHAGPAGSQVNATAANVFCGDACTSFCSLELAVCGTSGANSQYASMTACLTACNGDGTATHPGFDKTHLYTVDATMTPPKTPSGNSLACRIYHTTNASLDAAHATQHCPHTQETPNGPCAGAAMP